MLHSNLSTLQLRVKCSQSCHIISTVRHIHHCQMSLFFLFHAAVFKDLHWRIHISSQVMMNSGVNKWQIHSFSYMHFSAGSCRSLLCHKVTITHLLRRLLFWKRSSKMWRCTAFHHLLLLAPTQRCSSIAYKSFETVTINISVCCWVFLPLNTHIYYLNTKSNFM